jgi:drug/metabolite transporter (DMT)-like permease
VSIAQNKNFFALFGLLFGATVWGIIWFPYRLLDQAGISGITASFYTYGIAMLIGCLIFSPHWRTLRRQPNNIIYLILAAGWTNLSYVLAIIDGEVMRVILLFYLSPVWTLLLAHFWLKERAGIKDILVIITSLLGAFIMLYDPANRLPLPSSQSDWLALSAGMGFALTNVITRKSVHLSLMVKSFAVWLGATMIALLAILFFEEIPTLPATVSTHDWLMMLVVGLLLFVSTLLVQYGVTHVAAARAAVIFLFELVVAAIAAYFLAAETMSLNAWLGGILIITAAILASMIRDETHT